MSASKAADTTRDDEVDHLADIAIFADETGGNPRHRYTLGDTLPDSADPETAAWLASDLPAASAGCVTRNATPRPNC